MYRNKDKLTFDIDFCALDVRHQIVLWVVDKKNVDKLGVESFE